MKELAAVAIALVALGACSSPPPQTGVLDPAAVVVSPHPWPSGAAAAPGAPPRILTVYLNETAIATGTHWIGRIATTTNVASLEVRTESFQFLADRTAYGEFRFDQHVLDMLPQYRRDYVLQLIARNANGDADQRFVNIRFL
jgi:hypothetical protein